ncbi:unnamed protein product, partial [Rotaria magnacalcarata]
MDVTSRYQPPTRSSQLPTSIQSTSSRNPITCWHCYETGHYSNGFRGISPIRISPT